MRKSYLICFIGIDGAGKTTIARLLAEKMSRSGIKTRYAMGRFETFKLLSPAVFVVKRVLSMLGKRTDQSAEGISTKRKMSKNRFLAALWRFSVSLDYFIQLGYKMRLPLMLGESVCSDRYLYDTVVDLTADGAISTEKMVKTLENMLNLSPKPKAVFLIDLPEDVAYERNLGKHDTLSRDYLGERRRLFLNFKGRQEVEVLDGCGQPRELLMLVEEKLRAKRVLV